MKIIGTVVMAISIIDVIALYLCRAAADADEDIEKLERPDLIQREEYKRIS